MKQLTSSQRKILSAAASKLNALVIIGQNGLSEGIVKKCAECLENHELVKIKFNEFKDEKKSLTEELCQKTGAALVRIPPHHICLVSSSYEPIGNMPNR